MRLRTHTKSDGRQDVVQKDADNGSITPTSDKWMSFPQVSALVVENKKLKEEVSVSSFVIFFLTNTSFVEGLKWLAFCGLSRVLAFTVEL